MHTKFKFIYAKPLENCEWKYLVNINLANSAGYISFTEDENQYTQNKNSFLELMQEQYSNVNERYNIRWTDHSADIRFKSESDAASFILLYTYTEQASTVNKRRYPQNVNHSV